MPFRWEISWFTRGQKTWTCHVLQTASREEREERTDLGLVKGHAYGITAVKKVAIGGTGLASFFRFDG